MELNKINLKNQPSPCNKLKANVCYYCGQSSKTVFVHGHEQCVLCKINVKPCCQGVAS